MSSVMGAICCVTESLPGIAIDPRAHRSGRLDRIRSMGGVSECHVIGGENAFLVSEKAAASSSGTIETPLYAILGMVFNFPTPWSRLRVAAVEDVTLTPIFYESQKRVLLHFLIIGVNNRILFINITEKFYMNYIHIQFYIKSCFI
ncbi:hypothetical protein [Methanothermobacter sp.]|uniref:hypothetical protein n=1 Tax=Methanothermobacter sp. TaxID=1884223 RepID=UPI003C70C335